MKQECASKLLDRVYSRMEDDEEIFHDGVAEVDELKRMCADIFPTDISLQLAIAWLSKGGHVRLFTKDGIKVC